jgi:hypothetical protein
MFYCSNKQFQHNWLNFLSVPEYSSAIFESNLPSEPLSDNLYKESLATPSVAFGNFVGLQTFRLLPLDEEPQQISGILNIQL